MTGFSFAQTRPRRRPSLTPMIDVVFLLLVFFMLAARFGQEGALDLRIAGGGAAPWDGPPRLVRIEADRLLLNGRVTPDGALATALTGMTDTVSDLILIQPDDSVDLQRLLEVLTLLEGAGFTALALVEP